MKKNTAAQWIPLAMLIACVFASRPLSGQEDNFLPLTDKESEAELVARIEKGADYQSERENEVGFPLCYYAATGKTQVVAAMIAKGVEVNAVPKHGLSALMWASKSGQKETVQILLDAGADASLPDTHSKTAITHAAINGHPAVVEMLVKAGGSLEDQYIGGYTDLMLAVIGGDETAAAKLLAEGADINMVTSNPPGLTCLHLAVIRNNSKMLAWVLAQKPELEPESHRGTPRALAAAERRAELADAIRAAGAKK